MIKTDNALRRKSIFCVLRSSSLVRIWLGCIAILLGLPGCAARPWGDLVPEGEIVTLRQQTQQLLQRSGACGSTLAGDIRLFYTDPVKSRALKGYLQLNKDKDFKFVTANPFGQPILVIAGDHKSYQTIQVFERRYLAGSLQSFGLRHNVPQQFLKADWWAWLTGGPSQKFDQSGEIRVDKQGKGIWVALTQGTAGHGPVEYLHLDVAQGRTLGRLVEESDGTILARLAYQDWKMIDDCPQPTRVQITGLDFGAEIRVELDEVTISDSGINNRLTIPRGFSRLYLP